MKLIRIDLWMYKHTYSQKSNTMKKKLPRFRSDKAAEDFVAKADLTEYDLSEMRPIRFEFQAKSKRVNMRLPPQLLDAVRASAAKAGVPYQRFIRQALEDAVLRNLPDRRVRARYSSLNDREFAGPRSDSKRRLHG